MMQEIPASKQEEDSSDEPFEPPAERWAPLGASSTPPPNIEKSDSISSQRLIQLEDEQEQLNSSLLALTTHFAQVQFRLQQICKSSGDQKEMLLKELEEFAFKGCPDIMEAKRSRTWHSNDPVPTTPEHDAIMEQQRMKQLQLIRQLKEQLEDLERFAYETGEAGLPTSEVMEKQKVIIDQLRDRMDLDIEQFDSLSSEELQWQVDQAVKRLVNPMKVKEQLVQQLKTQITDLERFIEFLQGEGIVVGNQIQCSCNPDKSNVEKCFLHGPKKLTPKSFGFNSELPQDKHRRGSADRMLNQTLALMQVYILSQFGCQSKKFRKNELKKTSHGCHWGDLRASLELSIRKVTDVAVKFQNYQRPATLNPYNSDEEDVDDIFDQCPEELVAAVRKVLCPALRDLIQHGMVQPTLSSGKSLVQMGCFSARSKQVDGGEVQLHAWDAILKYYEMKHGKEYSDAPVRKLSQSFNLDNIGGRAVTSKQMLLSTVDNIVATHTRLKRSQDAMFKAFVSAALNHKKLVGWLRMILRTKEIVDECYAPWSYVAKTNFDDACGALEKLNQFSFNLPVDLAVRPFQNIRDIF